MADSGHADRVGAVVTGGAGGIGLAVATRLAADGHHVFALDADAAAVRQATATKDPALAIDFGIVDVRDVDRLTAAVDEAMSAMSRPAVLCACAGIKPPVDIATVTPAAWDDVFAVNVRGAFFAAQAALPHLVAARGSIVFVGSASAHGDHENPLYGASKAALTGLAASLAQATMAVGVRVNVVVPGFTRTGMAASPDDERLAAAARRNVAGRVNTGADVAAAIAWIAGPGAETVSGAVLDVGCLSGVPARYGPIPAADSVRRNR